MVMFKVVACPRFGGDIIPAFAANNVGWNETTPVR